MASSSAPKILTFKADGAIPKGAAVQYGTDNQHVAKATAATQKIIGIAQNAAVNAEDRVEVALPSGGGKGLSGGSISGGDLVTSDGNGALVATTTPGDRYIGMAMDGASAADLFSLEVVAGLI